MRNLLRIFLGLVLVSAGVVKLLHPVAFLTGLQSYGVPGPYFVWQIIAASFPWLEIILGLALVVNVWAETVRPATVALFTVFSVLLGQALLRGLSLDCGCFGNLLPAWAERPPVALVRAIVLLAGSIFLLTKPSHSSVAP